MRTLIVITCVMTGLLHFTEAQCPVSNCGTITDRGERTGCRLFCTISQNRANMVKADLQRVHDQLKNPQGVTERGAWNGWFRTNTQMCVSEASDVFDTIADMGGGDPNVIQQVDIDALWDLLSLGGENVDYEMFQDWWSALYLLIEDPDCPDGYRR